MPTPARPGPRARRRTLDSALRGVPQPLRDFLASSSGTYDVRHYVKSLSIQLKKLGGEPVPQRSTVRLYQKKYRPSEVVGLQLAVERYTGHDARRNAALR